MSYTTAQLRNAICAIMVLMVQSLGFLQAKPNRNLILGPYSGILSASRETHIMVTWIPAFIVVY